jgi:DNA mismatch repair protein MutL
MPRIQQLPASVITKIAAGEVIERPASVVKELLENAVDAGSSRIDIEVENGGVEAIRVVDDGCGIAADDLPLAFASHATSKLNDADDLFRIRTLGFRGEALASIGGVSHVTLQSRLRDHPSGAEIHCDGGQLGPVRTWNGSPGTRMEVKHVFFNTPVRRKFLRSTGTEMGHICEAFTRVALAQKQLHLTLRHNDKAVYEVSAATGLLDRLKLFYGAEVCDHLYGVEVQHSRVSLHGFIADPSCDRGTAKMQYLFVNGRCIRDRSLGHALQKAYRGLLMTGRYAVAFLFLDLPPDEVDVNVHPTKIEVRFRDAQALHHLVFAACRDRLRAANLTPRLQVPVNRGQWTMTEQPRSPDVSQWPPPPSAPAMPAPASRNAFALLPEPPAPPPQTVPPIDHGSPPTNGYKAIQLYDSYLVLETEEGMLVIDQHALHERILFEQLKQRIRSGSLEVQKLLIPETVELPSAQAARTLEQRAALAELGLQVEDFGGGTLLLSSYPAILGNRSPQALLRAVVDQLASHERLPEREHLLNDLLSLMACHSAVRAGDRLTPEEIAALIAQRELADDTHHCPHGRPTSLLFSRQELDRQFRRV